MNVRHEPDAGRFVIPLGAYEAALMYARRGDVVDLYHVYVPEPYRKRGHADRLLKAAFSWARKRGLTVVPSCPFIRGNYLPWFPGEHDVVDFEADRFPHAENGTEPDSG